MPLITGFIQMIVLPLPWALTSKASVTPDVRADRGFNVVNGEIKERSIQRNRYRSVDPVAERRPAGLW